MDKIANTLTIVSAIIAGISTLMSVIAVIKYRIDSKNLKVDIGKANRIKLDALNDKLKDASIIITDIKMRNNGKLPIDTEQMDTFKKIIEELDMDITENREVNKNANHQ